MCAETETWFALYVRPRHEKSVQKILDYKGYVTSLPLRKCYHTRSSGSAWKSEKPLISGYVFVAHNPQNPFHVVTTPGVVQIVSFGSGPGSIPDAEIRALERIAASGLPVAKCAYTKIGERIELIDGPMKGLQGFVLREAKGTRLVVTVELLQRSVSVDIDATWAAPVRYVAGAGGR